MTQWYCPAATAITIVQRVAAVQNQPTRQERTSPSFIQIYANHPPQRFTSCCDCSVLLSSSFTSVWIPPELKIQNFWRCAVHTGKQFLMFWKIAGPSSSKSSSPRRITLVSDFSWPWRSRRHDLRNVWHYLPTRTTLTYQKIWIFSNTAVRIPPNHALSRVIPPAKCRTAMQYNNMRHSCIDTLTAHDNTLKSTEQWAKAKYKGRVSEIFISTLGQEHHFVRSFRFQCFARSSFP